MLAFFDCFSGVAGDMILGALLDAGLPLARLKRELSLLPVKGYSVRQKTEKRGLLAGVNFHVRLDEGLHRHHRRFKDIVRMISSSRMKRPVRELSCEIFRTLGSAEARVHRVRLDDVHFHEVGAVDSIVDIVGAAIGFHYFGFSAVYASSLPMTKGFVNCAHGRMPLPAPATLEMLKGVPVYNVPLKEEIVTPTGAAILKTVVREFGRNPIGTVKGVGYGLGDLELKGVPNGLRLVMGEGEALIVIEANIDDMNPQFYDFVIDRLMAGGAIDVTIKPVLMKKRRFGSEIKVLCAEAGRDRLIRVMLSETTTIGVRYYPVSREVLERRTVSVKTIYGPVRVKISGLSGNVFNVSPEYDDCRRAAVKKKVPIKDVYQAAMRAVG